MNRAGGILDLDVTIVVGDTQTSSRAGVAAAKNLVSEQKVTGIVGALSSGVTIAVAKSVTIPGQVLQISSASTSPEISRLKDQDFIFRTAAKDAGQGVALARLFAQKSVRKIAVIYIDNAYGRNLNAVFSRSYKGSITQAIAYNPLDNSYRAELKKAAKGGADRLLLIAYPKQGTVILNQAIKGNYFKTFAFADGMKNPAIVKAVGAEYLNGSFATAPRTIGTGAKPFRRIYRTKFGALPPLPYIDTAYDAAMLIGLSALMSGKFEAKAMRQNLRMISNPPGSEILPGEFRKAKKLIKAGKQINYTGASGSLDMDEFGDVSSSFVHWEIQRGKIVIVKSISATD